jgi:hypothetical protein
MTKQHICKPHSHNKHTSKPTQPIASTPMEEYLRSTAWQLQLAIQARHVDRKILSEGPWWAASEYSLKKQIWLHRLGRPSLLTQAQNSLVDVVQHQSASRITTVASMASSVKLAAYADFCDLLARDMMPEIRSKPLSQPESSCLSSPLHLPVSHPCLLIRFQDPRLLLLFNRPGCQR